MPFFFTSRIMGCFLHFESNSWWDFMASDFLQISSIDYGMQYCWFVPLYLYAPATIISWLRLKLLLSSAHVYLLTFLRHFLQASILVLAIFSISSSQPLLSQISLRKREPQEFETMGQALGIPDSGLLLQREPTQVIDPNEPLDKLLLDKRFRQSFMAFADRCCISAKLQHLGIHLCGKHSYIPSVFFFFNHERKIPRWKDLFGKNF